MKNFKWDKKYLYWGVTAFAVIMGSIAFFWVLNRLSSIVGFIDLVMTVLSPVIYGLLIAYLLNKVLSFFEAHMFKPLAARLFPSKPVTARKAARIFSIIVTLALAIGILSGLLVIILPQIGRSVAELVSRSGDYVNVAAKWIENFFNGDELQPVAVEWLTTLSDKLVEWLETHVLPQINTVITSITGGVISVISTVVNFFIGVIISVYIMYNKETFCAQAKKLLFSILRPKAANNVLEEMEFINTAFGDYIIGTIIDSLIVGVVNYIFMVIAGIPYAALVSIIVAVTNIIPMFGPFIGAVPSALLILMESDVKCLIFIIFTLVLQQIDGQILKPRIHSSRTGLSGFWIMFAILLFGGLFGVTGMVLGVPLTTVLYSIVRRLNNRRLRVKGLPEDTNYYKAIDRIDVKTGKPIYKQGMEPTPEQPEGDEPPKGSDAKPDTKQEKKPEEEREHESVGD